MNDRQRKRLAELQIEGKLNSYRHTKAKHLRPWTGAHEFVFTRREEFALLDRDLDRTIFSGLTRHTRGLTRQISRSARLVSGVQ